MLKAIAERRSVRAFRDDDVSDEQIEIVLKAGFCAPSAHGTSPWHAVVVRDQAVRDALASVHRYSGLVARSPVVIVVCVDTAVGSEPFWIEDASAFMENMLIQAASMGLGTCWVAIKRALASDNRDVEQAVRDMLHLPLAFHVLGMTPLGVPASRPEAHKGLMPKGRVHLDRFGHGGRR